MHLYMYVYVHTYVYIYRLILREYPKVDGHRGFTACTHLGYLTLTSSNRPLAHSACIMYMRYMHFGMLYICTFGFLSTVGMTYVYVAD